MAVDILGKTFGRLTVIRDDGRDARGQVRVLCQCSCGNTTSPRIESLVSGNTKSCGCLRKELSHVNTASHGCARTGRHTREYRIWAGMIGRCEVKSNAAYPQYGGIGITVSEKLRSFEGFLDVMGKCPDGHTIDRIKSSGNYEEGNVRWATPKQQARNTRKNRMVTIDGVSRCVAEWAELVGISRWAIYARLNLGWSEEAAVMIPVRSHVAKPRSE